MLIPDKFSGYRAGRRIYPKKDAPDPDPAIGQASLEQIGLARDKWNNYVNVEQPWNRQITQQAIDTYSASQKKSAELTDYQLEQMRYNDNRYRSVAVPFENELLNDVKRFDSQAYKDQQVASALADTQTQFDATQAQMTRGLSRMGVNPNSGKMAAATGTMGIERAKAMASAANKTRQAAEQIGLSTKMQMYGGMKGLAGLGATNAGLATNALGMGNSSAAGMTGAANSFIGTGNASFGTAMQGMSSGISGLANYSQLGMQAAQIRNDADPTAAILGAATTFAMASDRRLKTNIEPVGTDERTGLTLYKFAYKTEPDKYFIGVMADEVEKVEPKAVITMPNGFKAVNYGALGIQLKEVA